MIVEAVISIINALGIMALVTLAYGKLQRLPYPAWQRHIAAGTVFGVGAMVEMLDPTVLAPGLIIDNRTLFIAFAALFLGPIGAATALTIGVATRVVLGGVGVFPGVAAMLIAALIGLAWTAPRLRPERLRLSHLILIGVSVSFSLATLLLLPTGVRETAIVRLLPWLFAFNLLGTVVFGSLLEASRERAKTERSLSEAAERDPLTNLQNRRGLTRAFTVLQQKMAKSPIAVLMIDLDHFKKINDRFGHHIGDEVLSETARTIEATVRAGDVVARLGGEEFAVLLPNTSSREARKIADRIRVVISQHIAVGPNRSSPVTASIGAAHFMELPNISNALQIADARLYEAKSAGRNTVIFSSLGTIVPGTSASAA